MNVPHYNRCSAHHMFLAFFPSAQLTEALFHTTDVLTQSERQNRVFKQAQRCVGKKRVKKKRQRNAMIEETKEKKKKGRR